MTEEPGKRQRAHLAKSIEEKLGLIAKMRTELERKKKIAGSSIDDQISVAEYEYRLVKEEMALLSLQEQHWESAALWDKQPPAASPDNQRVCEALHSYIQSVRERGSIPALHASEHPALENSVLVSCGQEGPSIPQVEWAHHSTDLQAGDRLLEVNGHLLIGCDPTEVSRLLSSSRPVCRVVFLRPVASPRHVTKGGRETSNLRRELTSVVGRLNHTMLENSRLKDQSNRLQSESEDLKIQNQKLKLQILSLQSVLLYLYRILEKNKYQVDCDTFDSELFSQCSSIFELLSKDKSNDLSDKSTTCKNAAELIANIEVPTKTFKGSKSLQVVLEESSDNR
ncbi:uncharacterized protein LOC129223306 [Uloborus diversus]|uniref:uncharacterized protein LOC129223306 n=1 Tax=Uloborus diversus TaxID=327109 RepID=UPI0024093FFF|nr:uncharacterized protein LOC129223306 [Uloborus diversus]